MSIKIKTSLSLDEGLLDEARRLGIANPSAWVNDALQRAVTLRRQVWAGTVVKGDVAYSPVVLVRAHLDLVVECEVLEGVDDWRARLLDSSDEQLAAMIDDGRITLEFDVRDLDSQLISYEVAHDRRVLHVHFNPPQKEFHRDHSGK